MCFCISALEKATTHPPLHSKIYPKDWAEAQRMTALTNKKFNKACPRDEKIGTDISQGQVPEKGTLSGNRGSWYIGKGNRLAAAWVICQSSKCHKTSCCVCCSRLQQPLFDKIGESRENFKMKFQGPLKLSSMCRSNISGMMRSV